MLDKKLSYKDKSVLVTYLAKSYINSVRRVEIMQFKGISEKDTQYLGEISSINLINAVIEQCSSTSQIILRNEYFGKRETKWFLEYFSKSNFYRLRKVAIEEFIDCLNI
ncbi:MG284/MPN403 family protein [Anaerorhabdus sp.]|jgi:hypothetical protein|uniref:MG284/MPN403 family protein n=1 Tax=Anaerorhabdus sp. TaxID=1872524 RepID=UPI002FCA17FA